MSDQMFQALSYREARDKGKIDLAEELQREVAAKAGELTENPARRIDKPRIDRRGKVRFLDGQCTPAKPAREITPCAPAFRRSPDTRRTALHEHRTPAR